MTKNNDILSKIGREDGLTVPQGFFDDFAKRMAAELPERPELERPRIAKPRTLWQKVRPYAYMAAMFAGVWCMLKMFTLMSNTNDPLSIEAHPALANAVSNDDFVDTYVIDDLSRYDLYDSMMEDSIDFDALSDSAMHFDDHLNFDDNE